MADAFSNLFIGNESSLFASSISFISFYLACLPISQRCHIVPLRARSFVSRREEQGSVVYEERRLCEHIVERKQILQWKCKVSPWCSYCFSEMQYLSHGCFFNFLGIDWRDERGARNLYYVLAANIGQFYLLVARSRALCSVLLRLDLDGTVSFICFWFSLEIERWEISRTLVPMKLSNYRRNNNVKCNGLKSVLGTIAGSWFHAPNVEFKF